ncbi:RNA 2',3'-cyclic phosphodiesterase [Enhygromyxa salina]|uniref:RNA 2',3'-cyclic phosphodiesterase n=1 Tax=Enhygromyxa salina TaxID=215803 RepID=A0A2S9XN33_9BACT|nr:RNA 2',3'-cyclic phosphodiesterase [Enhygromyxa salina]PRP94262.1 RNA 2',3'-cyclic phosphodiesterase [Enhygromyxa salina]
MSRLFLGLDLPDDVDFDLSLMAGGIRGARWQAVEQLHLTLHFLGELDGGEARRLIAALDQVETPAFELQLGGAGVFPPRGQPRTAWIGVTRGVEPLELAHQRCARIIDACGVERDRRKWTPHVTVARMGRDADSREVNEWVRNHALYASASFRVEHLRLYSSIRSQQGPKYRTEAVFALRD